jgi:hypothetical protein
MLKANQLKFLEAATREFGSQAVIPAKDITAFANSNGFANADHSCTKL